MQERLVIVGAGGFGREVAWLVERINAVQPTWELLGFIDDSVGTHGMVIDGYPVLGDCDWVLEHAMYTYVVCAVGASKARRKLVERLRGVRFATLIDPTVEMSDRVEIGEGWIICAGTILTVNVTLGSHVIVNPVCTIGHDAVLGDYTTLYPSVNVSGTTCLGECVEMGTGSQIIQGLRVGEGTIVGAGAVVIKELPRECTAVGSPAKPIKFQKSCDDTV